MDNCCCYTSTTGCLGLFRKVILFDSAAFLIKIGVAIYFLVIGIEYKIKDGRIPHEDPDYHSPATIYLYIFGGCILLVFIVTRLIINCLLYNDSNRSENTMFTRPQCCNFSWMIVTTGSLIFSCVVAAVPNIPLIIRITAWFSILVEPLIIIMIFMTRRVVNQRQRFSMSDGDSNYN